MFVPQHVDALESRNPKHVLVQCNAAGAIEMIVIDEATAWLQEPTYRFVTGSDLAHVLEIVDRDADTTTSNGPPTFFPQASSSRSHKT